MTDVPAAWWFVGAAYALCAAGTLGLVAWSVVTMRRAEAQARALDQR
jgi:hypothetical protein